MTDGNPLYIERTTCRLCKEEALTPILVLSPIPVATPNVDSKALGPQAREAINARVPLELQLCKSCGHMQLSHVVRPDIQYRSFRYVTTISAGLPEHFRSMAQDIVTETRLPPEAFVVEIGSNDGTLLRCFQEEGFRVLGIDPAENIARKATEAGVETLANFFSGDLGRSIAAELGKADVIIANNTFANLDDLDDIMDGVEALLSDDGAFVIETQYGRDVIDKLLIDTIYHEHLSYFMVASLLTFFRRRGLELTNVQRIWTKGGSVRCVVRRAGHSVAPVVQELAKAEIDDGFLDPASYDGFRTAVEDLTATVKRHVAEITAKGGTVAGYGASIGSVTLITQFGLANVLDCIVDDKPIDETMHIAGNDIPILTSDMLYQRRPALTVVFAWRYADLILARHQPYMDEVGRFLLPLPEPRLEGIVQADKALRKPA